MSTEIKLRNLWALMRKKISNSIQIQRDSTDIDKCKIPICPILDVIGLSWSLRAPSLAVVNDCPPLLLFVVVHCSPREVGGVRLFARQTTSCVAGERAIGFDPRPQRINTDDKKRTKSENKTRQQFKVARISARREMLLNVRGSQITTLDEGCKIK